MSGLFERPPGNVYRLGPGVELTKEQAEAAYRAFEAEYPRLNELLTSDRLQRRQPLLDLDLASLYDETKGGYGV